MSPRAPKKKLPPPTPGDVAWTVRGSGPLPAQLAGGAPATDAELVNLVDSLAYRVLELIPQLSPEEITEAVAGVDPEGPLTLFVLQKGDGGTFGTLDTIDPLDWIEGLGPPLVGRLHGGGSYQLRVQARKNGVRQFIKQPMFRAPGRAAGAPVVAAPASSSTALELIKELGAIATAVAPIIKSFMGERAAAPASDPATFVRMFREGLELGKTTANKKSEGEGDVTFGRTLRELIPPALETLRGFAPGGSPAPAPPPPPVAAAAAPAGPPAPAWVVLLTPHVPELMKLARVHASVDYWAEQVLGMIDPEQLSFIADQLDRGDAWRAEFFQYFPDATPARSWFEKFFDAVDRELEPDDDGDDDGHQDEGPPQLNSGADRPLPGFGS